MYFKEDSPYYEKRKKDWEDIENAVFIYQKQFSDNATESDIIKSKEAALFIINKFKPLTTKYKKLLITGEIDWNDNEIKKFIWLFNNKDKLKKALNRKKQKAEYRNEIHQNFNFIKDSYGSIDPIEIQEDLNFLLLIIAKRYKKMNRNFCGYLYNSYNFEVYRHIKKFLKNPLNLSYKQIQYNDKINGYNDNILKGSYEDKYNENSLGLPTAFWTNGICCSEAFTILTTLDRKILVKYYLEEWKDKQIADAYGIHINTVNKRRRTATKKIAEELNIDPKFIKRTKRSGIKVTLPTQL